MDRARGIGALLAAGIWDSIEVLIVFPYGVDIILIGHLISITIFFFCNNWCLQGVNPVFVNRISFLRRSLALGWGGSVAATRCLLGRVQLHLCASLSVWTLATGWVESRDLVLTHWISHVLAEILIDTEQLLVRGVTGEYVAETCEQRWGSRSLLRIALLLCFLRFDTLRVRTIRHLTILFELVIRSEGARHFGLVYLCDLRSLFQAIRWRPSEIAWAATFHVLALILLWRYGQAIFLARRTTSKDRGTRRIYILIIDEIVICFHISLILWALHLLHR